MVTLAVNPSPASIAKAPVAPPKGSTCYLVDYLGRTFIVWADSPQAARLGAVAMQNARKGGIR